MSDSFFVDPAISRKSKIVSDKLKLWEGFPLPSVIEISESGVCNRKCAFCPRSDPNYLEVNEFIEEALVEKIGKDLSECSYSGIILFSGFVEPLLDKNIYAHIKTLKTYLPNARLELVTNGDVLDVSRLRQLFSAGLSTILISVYDGPEDAERLSSICLEANLIEGQYVIRHRYLPESQTFGITINNRSGMMSNAAYAMPALASPLKTPCNYPHYTLFIDYQGDVLMCPHDWGKKKIMGNLVKQGFLDVWLGSSFNTAREMLAKGDRRIVPCNVCDVKGGLMGAKHVDAWAKLKG